MRRSYTLTIRSPQTTVSSVIRKDTRLEIKDAALEMVAVLCPPQVRGAALSNLARMMAFEIPPYSKSVSTVSDCGQYAVLLQETLPQEKQP